MLMKLTPVVNFTNIFGAKAVCVDNFPLAKMCQNMMLDTNPIA